MSPDSTVSTRPAESRMMLDTLTRRLTAEAGSAAADSPSLSPFVTISRQAGSGGLSEARGLASELGWAFYDRELVESLARELKLDPHRLELMDETKSNWFRDTVLNLLDSKLVLQDSYAGLIGRVMMLAVHSGPVVLVGRAGHLILPRTAGLSVRIVAPRSWRTARLVVEEGLTEAAAAERIAKLDTAREDFIRRHFKQDPNDPSAFDMILDISSLGKATVGALIRQALEMKNRI